MTDSSYGSYGSTPPQAPPPARPVAGGGMATAALVLGILALLSCWTVVGGILLGLLALVFGIVGLRRANRGLALGRGRAIAGIILGLLGILVAGLLIAVGVSLFNSEEGRNLRDCLDDAGNNQTRIQQCQDEFRDQLDNP